MHIFFKWLKIFFGITSFILLFQEVSLAQDGFREDFSHSRPYPASIWSSHRFNQTILNIEAGSLNPKFEKVILTLSLDELILFSKNENQLIKITEKKANPREEWFRLNLFDINGDGYQEIIVSGFRFNRAQSLIFSLVENQLKLIRTYPYFIHHFFWNGEDILVAQKSFGEEVFSGPIFKLNIDANHELQLGEALIKKKSLKVKLFSLYQIEGIHLPNLKHSFLYLSDLGQFFHYQAMGNNLDQKWSSGNSYGGMVSYINRKVKTPFSQEKSDRFFIPIRFRDNHQIVNLSSDNKKEESIDLKEDQKVEDIPIQEKTIDRSKKQSVIYVMKNEGYLKSVIGAVPSVKHAQMVSLIWTGYGFQEVWNSPRLDGAISDFKMVDWDGDGKEEILVSFLLRDKGYVDTLKDQDSLLMVLKPNHDLIYPKRD